MRINIFNNIFFAKMKFICVTCALIVFLCSCGKKKPENLADSYFKLAFGELSDGGEQENSVRRALSFVQKALAVSQKSEYYALQGSLLFKLNDFEQSNNAFQKALAAHPDEMLRCEIVNNYACLLGQMGNTVEAKKLLGQLLEDTAYQTPEVAWVNMGKLLALEDKVTDAFDCFKKAAGLEPCYLDAHWNLALMAKASGQNTIAKQELETILSLEPTHVGAVQMLAHVG